MKCGWIFPLVTATALLTACSGFGVFSEMPPMITSECSWAQPIRFSPETKEWLQSIPWPDAAFSDFEKIGDHNELFELNCAAAP